MEMSRIPGPDQAVMEAIHKSMRVPDRLSVGPGRQWAGEEGDETMSRPGEHQPVYSMQVPDRLTYTEAPDMSPRPMFTPSKATVSPLGLELYWESPSGEVFFREALQSPIRRSYSDQSFGRTPPGTPTHPKQLTLPRHSSSTQGPGSPSRQCSSASLCAQTPHLQAKAQPPPSTLLSLLSSHTMLEAAKQLGLQASQRLLQAVDKYRLGNQEKHPGGSTTMTMTEVTASAHVEHRKKRVVENWSPEDEGGAAVEFIVLRRQVMKMSRRLAALERHNAERRNTEVVLFSLLFSACLLNAWLWIRR